MQQSSRGQIGVLTQDNLQYLNASSSSPPRTSLGLGGQDNMQHNGSGMGIYQTGNRNLGEIGSLHSQTIGRPLNSSHFDSSSFQMGSQPGPLNGRYSSVVSGKVVENDFSLEKEDFPALPGAQGNKLGENGMTFGMNSNFTLSRGDLGVEISSGGADKQQAAQMNQGISTSIVGAKIEAAGSQVGSTGQSVGSSSKSVGSTGGNNSSTVNGASQGSKSTATKFSLLGLVDIINLVDKDASALALGTDLTTFGLNLNSVDNLYPTFSSPFVDQSTSPEPQFTTPSCYLMQSPTLKMEHLSKFQVETLFYMFYCMPKDILQACAAQELYSREWKYHGELKIWLKARTQQELLQAHATVQFIYFDVNVWNTRLFNNNQRVNIAEGLLSEDDVRVKVPAPSGGGVAVIGRS